MRLLFLVPLTIAPMFGCFCATAATGCSGARTADAVFVGRVVVDGGQGPRAVPTVVAVEEPLANVPLGTSEIEFAPLAGTDCDYHLTSGEQYVVYASRNKADPARYSIAPCSKTFHLRGNEFILETLRNQAAGGPSRSLGQVFEEVTGNPAARSRMPGVRVVATLGTETREVFTGDNGVYEFRDISPGWYQIALSKPEFVANGMRPQYHPFLNSATGRMDAEIGKPGMVAVDSRSCEAWDLGMHRAPP